MAANIAVHKCRGAFFGLKHPLRGGTMWVTSVASHSIHWRCTGDVYHLHTRKAVNRYNGLVYCTSFTQFQRPGLLHAYPQPHRPAAERCRDVSDVEIQGCKMDKPLGAARRDPSRSPQRVVIYVVGTASANVPGCEPPARRTQKRTRNGFSTCAAELPNG